MHRFYQQLGGFFFCFFFFTLHQLNEMKCNDLTTFHCNLPF